MVMRKWLLEVAKVDVVFTSAQAPAVFRRAWSASRAHFHKPTNDGLVINTTSWSHSFFICT
jgi:hypothetical protein